MRSALRAALAAAAFVPFAAQATTGYFSHGYGIKAKGMGGVGIALPQDALAAATNPAGMAFVGNRMDLGVDWFAPDRGARIVGNAFPGVDGSYDGNDTASFLIPEFGYNRMLNPNLALGVFVIVNAVCTIVRQIRRTCCRPGRHDREARAERLSLRSRPDPIRRT